MTLKTASSIALCAMTANLCFGADPDLRLIDGIAAVVNRHVITVGDVLGLAQPALSELSRGAGPGESSARARDVIEEARETIIERYLILDSRDPKTQQVPDWIVDERIGAISRDSFGDDRTRLGILLQRSGMTYDQWREEIRDSIMVSALRSARVEQYARAVPASGANSGEQGDALPRQSPRVRIGAIVLGIGSSESEAEQQRKMAGDIVKRLRDGADFSAMVREHSKGGKADAGGDWGWLRLADLRPEFATAVSGLKPGDVSDPVETGGEIYILRVFDRQEDAAGSEIEARLAADRRKKEALARDIYRTWVTNLRKKAMVKTFDLEPFLAVAR